MNISNKTILITGANRGIGQALVQEALRRGAKKVYAGTRSGLQNADKRVTPLTLDVTDPSQIMRAAEDVGALDILINNAGIAIYDDLTDPGILDQHMAVNVLGAFKVTNAFLPQLRRSRGAIVNNLSVVSLAALPLIPSYSISKAAAFSMTQSLRALLAEKGVSVHAVFLGPVDTDMNRGLDIPKASPQSVAVGIFDALEKGEEDIFPDPFSQPLAEGWRTGVVKALERQNAPFLPKESRISDQSLTATFSVDQTPEEAFAAINDVRGWWSGDIEGDTDRLGAEFTYRNKDVHRSKQRITEFVPGKRVAWQVLDSDLNFVKDRKEWNGTRILFEISKKNDGTEVRFTHVGLAPDHECFDICSNAWGFYIKDSLRRRITTGKGQPNQTAAA